MSAWFMVTDPKELPTLLRALHAAKFFAPADGPELHGSPILARLLERAAEAWDAASDAGHLGSRLSKRPTGPFPPGPDIVESVRNHLSGIAARSGGNWAKWSLAEREEYVRLAFRPYAADEALVRELTTQSGPHIP